MASAPLRRDPGDSSAVGIAFRNEYLQAAAALALLLAIFFAPVVRHDATMSSVANMRRLVYPWAAAPTDHPEARFYPQSDQAVYVYPRQVFLDGELHRGHRVPLWNPLSLGGIPFFAESGSRLAYPPLILLTVLLSPTWTHDVYVVLHLFVAGVAAFALMKQLGVRFTGALLTGIAWMLSSYGLAWAMLETYGPLAALLPLALLFVRRWHDNSSWVDLGVATLALGLLLLGSGIDVTPAAFLVVVAYACALGGRRLVRDWADLGRRQRQALVAAPVALGAGAVVIAAPGLLPFVQLVGRSLRIAPPLPGSSLAPPGEFLRSFLPPALHSDFTMSWASLNGRQMFVGTLTAGLATAGLFLRRPGAGLGRALAAGTFAFLAFPVVRRIIAHALPIVSSPGRGLFVWDLGLAILAGLALDSLLRRIGAWSHRRRAAPQGSRQRPHRSAATALVAAVCVIVTGVQLVSYGRRVNPPFQRRTASQLFPTTPVIEAARAETGDGPGRGRVLGLVSLVGSTSMAVDLPAANGYANVVAANVSTLWRAVAGESPAAAAQRSYLTFQNTFDPATVRVDLLGRVGVKAVLAAPTAFLGPAWNPETVARRGLRLTYSGSDGTVYAVDDAPPRALVVGQAEWAPSAANALVRFVDPAFDVRRSVILQGSRPAAADQPPPTARDAADVGASTVTWLQDDPDRLRLSVTTDKGGWLLVLDSWDPDWVATVGGRDADVERADFGFRAVRVPAGTSTVTFSYRPVAVYIGISISLLTATGILAGMLLGWRRRRRRHRDGVAPGSSPPDRVRPSTPERPRPRESDV